ncbi:MAG: hypothetical protein BWY02_01366 [bacterium ADurb.Bin157]|nr:MAG: hypothetical protein BWY02_01366 [bacterium ADurb.Bin157]
MKKSFILCLISVFILLFFVESAEAGFSPFKDIEHTRNINNQVKGIYRERKSIERFAQSADTLAKEYNALDKNDSKNYLKILNIAAAITTLVTEFNNLAPKAEQFYKAAEPSLDYLSRYTDKTEELTVMGQSVQVKTLSEGKINSLARRNGISRAWGAIKENPINIFKWGRLKSEYKLGKAEAQYSLKCAQIAFEASTYYDTIRRSMQTLLNIQDDIKKIKGLNLVSIINAGTTVAKIYDAVGSIEGVYIAATNGTTKLNKRFSEMLDAQSNYAAELKAYNSKYKGIRITLQAPAASSPSNASSPTNASSDKASEQRIDTTISNINSGMTLLNAADEYAKAYKAYVAVSQNPNSDPKEVYEAVTRFKNAKDLYEQLKQQQSGK